MLNGLKIARDEFHFDVFADDLVEEAGEAVDDGIQVDGAELKGLTAGKGEELSSKRGGAIGLLADVGKTFGDGGKGMAFFVTEFGPAEDCADHIVEIVSDAAGKLADGSRISAPGAIGVREAKFGDVFDDTFDGIGGSGERKVAQMETDGDQAAILATPFRFVAVNQAMLAAGGEQRE